MATSPPFQAIPIIGRPSTFSDSSAITSFTAETNTYVFVSTFNATSKRGPYKFQSESERLKYNLGQLNVLGGRGSYAPPYRTLATLQN